MSTLFKLIRVFIGTTLKSVYIFVQTHQFWVRWAHFLSLFGFLLVQL